MQTPSFVDYSLFKNRRKKLHALLHEYYSKDAPQLIILFADFEHDRHVFRQESSFYYLTGITDPGVVLLSHQDGREILYLPNYGLQRTKWVNSQLDVSPATAKRVLVNEVKYLGENIKGYVLSPFFGETEYRNVLADLGRFLETGVLIGTMLDRSTSRHVAQVQCCAFLQSFYPVLRQKSVDITPVVCSMRCVKDNYEINQMYKAVQVTSFAHEAAAGAIKTGIKEYEVQACIEHIFTALGTKPAFASIVASGKNGTVLHYTERNHELKSGDVVVVDIGAEHDYYASDITRTYPVSGTFTKRQREVYDVVLAAQEYVELRAKPGMFLRNPQEPEKSLHHLAYEYLKKAGYAEYFTHCIGHYLGLDVHDGGDMTQPLEPGVTFTIEPGIYIPNEHLGVRVEDDYVIVDDGCVCLSAHLPRSAQDIEQLMKKNSMKSKK